MKRAGGQERVKKSREVRVNKGMRWQIRSELVHKESGKRNRKKGDRRKVSTRGEAVDKVVSTGRWI